MGVGFTGGIDDISQQIAVGLVGTSLQQVITSSSGWTLRPQNNGAQTLIATVLVSADATPGGQITGTASVPTGATLTAAVNNGAKQTIANGSFSLDVPTGSGIGSLPAPSLSVSPGAAKAGERVKVSGSVAGGCPRGDAVTLTSKAFAGTYRFAGLPAVYANVRRGGRFAVTTRIPATRKPSRYVLNARCGRGNLGVTAHLRITRGG